MLLGRGGGRRSHFVYFKTATNNTFRQINLGGGRGRLHGRSSNLSVPSKRSLSCAVSFGKSSSISVAVPDAIFSSSLPATPRLRAAADAAAASDTPHDFMGKKREARRERGTPAKRSNNEIVAQLTLSRTKTERSVVLAKSSRK